MEKELIQDQDQTKEVIVDTKDDTVTATETTTDTTAEDNSTATDKELNTNENTQDVSPDMFSEEEPAKTDETPTEETNTPEQYDLSAYNLNEDQVSTIQPVLDRFKEVGMTQEQMDVVFEEIIGEPKDYKAELTAALSTDEKRAYKPMFELLNNIEGNSPEEVLNVMRDVQSVRFLNRLINRLSRPVMASGMTTPGADTKAGQTLDALKSEFKDFARKANVKPGDRAKFIDGLISKAGNKEEATQYFKKFK